jgi:hypothetical protein
VAAVLSPVRDWQGPSTATPLVQRALLREPVIHPLEGTKRTNQSTPRLKLLLIAVIAFGPMDHCFVGTRIQILFSFRCAGGAAVSVESAATSVQH